MNIVRKDLKGRFNEIDIVKKYKDRILLLLNKHIIPPYEVLIHPTNKCNLKCIWCIGKNASTGKKDKIPELLSYKENMLKLIDDIIQYKKKIDLKINNTTIKKEYSIENVSFSGIIGEPLIAKESVLPAMEKLVDNKKRIGIFTNGTLMDSSTWDIISNIGYVLVSIDAGKGITYSKMKTSEYKYGEVLFNNVLENIEGLSNYKSKYNKTLDINAGFVINEYNYEEIFELAKILKNIGVHYFRLKTDIASILKLNNKQVERVKYQIHKVKSELEDKNFKIVEIHRIGIDNTRKREFTKCQIHSLVSAVGADGNLYPCNYHPCNNGYKFGNVSMEGFQNVWEKRNLNNLELLLPKICPDVCDPFKNRANRLLSIIEDKFNNFNSDEFESFLDKLVAGEE